MLAVHVGHGLQRSCGDGDNEVERTVRHTAGNVVGGSQFAVRVELLQLHGFASDEPALFQTTQHPGDAIVQGALRGMLHECYAGNARVFVAVFSRVHGQQQSRHRDDEAKRQQHWAQCSEETLHSFPCLPASAYDWLRCLVIRSRL